MPNPYIRTLVAGSLLGAACGTSDDPYDGYTHNPPPTNVLRSWEQATDRGEVTSTNPPSPVLITTGEGLCYVAWEGGMVAPGPDRVDPTCVDGHCGEQIVCPEPRTTALVDAYKASMKPESTNPPPIEIQDGLVNPPPPERPPINMNPPVQR